MSDLISREDAINAVAVAALDDRDELEAIKAIPSAEAVSMEEHIKELNDLAVEWKTKFAKAEKITDEIYDETMAKVAKECEECKERLRNIRPSAEAENESCGTCKYFETSHREYPCSDCTVGNSHYVSAEAVQGAWIPCSERLPEDLEAVNVTWVNHNPPVYYQYTKDVPNADTAVYYRGVWYWWDSTICDVLGEYGEKCGAEQIDKDIEILAWMPLPKPYREESEVEE